MSAMSARIAAAIACSAVATHTLRADFWASLNGPDGGIVPAMVHLPTSDVLLAGTSFGAGYNQVGGSLFRSLDHGASWSDSSGELAALPQNTTQAKALAVSPSGLVYLATDLAGVFTSADGGVHWIAANAGLPATPNLRDLSISSSGEVLCSSSTGGVYALNTQTGVWSPIVIGLTTLNAVSLAHGSGFTLCGTRGGGVFKRTGTGSWVAANVGLGSMQTNRVIVTASGTAYAATDAGLFSSSDAAATWAPVAGPFGSGLVNVVAQVGPSLFVGTALTGFRSADEGASWTPILQGQTPRTFIGDAAGRVYAGTNQLGVLRSDDGGVSWTAANHGLVAQSIFRVIQTPAGIFAGTQRNGVIRSRDGGATWDAATLAERAIFSLAASPWGDLFAGNYNINAGQPDGHAWRSTDGGTTWSPLDSGLSAAMVSGFVFPSPGEVLCTSAWNPGGVSRSTNNGDVWTRLGPPQNIPAYFLVRSPSGDLYFGTEGLGVWRLPASGTTWEFKDLTISQQFTAAFNSSGHVFIGNDGRTKGVWRSTDGGQTFGPLASFPSMWGYSILVLPSDEIYVATRDLGVQRSTDGGTTWQGVNSGIPTTACYWLSLGSDGFLYAGTAGHGVFRSVLPVVATGVCCRGATCNTSLTASSCTSASPAGASFFAGLGSCNAPADVASPCCYADYNKSNGITVADIFDFLNSWFSGSLFANVGGDGASGTLTVQNIFDFLNAWFSGGC